MRFSGFRCKFGHVFGSCTRDFSVNMMKQSNYTSLKHNDFSQRGSRTPTRRRTLTVTRRHLTEHLQRQQRVPRCLPLVAKSNSNHVTRAITGDARLTAVFMERGLEGWHVHSGSMAFMWERRINQRRPWYKFPFIHCLGWCGMFILACVCVMMTEDEHAGLVTCFNWDETETEQETPACETVMFVQTRGKMGSETRCDPIERPRLRLAVFSSGSTDSIICLLVEREVALSINSSKPHENLFVDTCDSSSCRSLRQTQSLRHLSREKPRCSNCGVFSCKEALTSIRYFFN